MHSRSFTVLSMRAVMVFIAMVVSLPAVAQTVDWGYRPVKDQLLRYNKVQRMKLVGHQNDVSIEENFEVLIREIDSTGAFLFNVRCASVAKRPDSSGQASVAHVFHGPSILADGTFAEISVTRYGEFVAGRFDREPTYMKQHRAALLRTPKADPQNYERERQLLKHIAAEFFPPLCDSSTMHVGSAWIDSVNKRSLFNPKDTLHEMQMIDSGVQPLRWACGSSSYFGADRCTLWSIRPVAKQEPTTDPQTILLNHANVYMRQSDGLIVRQESELEGMTPEFKAFRSTVQLTLVVSVKD